MKYLIIFLFGCSFTISAQSKSIGTVSYGSLENGVKVPFQGKNYSYFDQISYAANRAYLHEKALSVTLKTYDKLDSLYPNKHFVIMECSNKHGGEMKPHSTHQNGTSVDFMSPLIKDNKVYDKLDKMGASHYLLEFNNDGQYIKDTSISIDFNLIAHHVLILDEIARKNGMYVKKVILKTDLKDEFYKSKYGKLVKEKGIYLVKSLPKRVNDVHDDHYHIDFGFL